MCRQVFAGVVLFCLTTSALAQTEREPTGPSPYLSIVTEVDRSGQTISFVDKDLIPEMKEKQIENEVTGEPETVTETVWVLDQMSTTVQFDQVRIYTAGKKPANVEALKSGMAVLTFPAGYRIDRRYLELFREDTLILVIPTEVLLKAWLEAGELEAEAEVEAPAPPAPVIDDSGAEEPPPPTPVVDPSA